jgi:hypothetical protein
MESPDTTDAAAYAQNLALLSNLMPAMPTAARSRAAWSVARSKLDLAAAVRAEGFDLHAAPARAARTAAPAPRPAATPAAPAAPAATRTVASHATTATPAPVKFTPEALRHLKLAGEIMTAPTEQAKRAIIARAESEDLATRAKALQERDGISFRAAVERLTVTR